MMENVITISIHAARVGCDLNPDGNVADIIISIHAARVGCDPSVPSFKVLNVTDFNPRSPSGLRRKMSENLPAI